MLTRYIIKRLILLIPAIAGHDPRYIYPAQNPTGRHSAESCGERADQETIDSIRKEIGADKDALHQYAGYLTMLLHGDFGKSYYTNRDVLSDIALKFPNTMKLAFAAMAIAVPLGIIMGYIAAYRKGELAGKIIDSLSLAGLSIPVFWSAIIIMICIQPRG